jgi:ribosomal protein S21
LSKPTNVSVRLGGKIRTSEQLIRLFIRKCKRERIIQEYRETLVYETKGQKRRRKRAQSKARRKREEDSNKSDSTKDKLRR